MPALQKRLWEVRKAGLNIMMSMKGDGKPVSFIEDCAVPLEHLADYTDRLTQVFDKHGTQGTWYAHASVGTLHVRPVLDMRRDGAAKMRAIAEEACALVREYKGAVLRRARRRPGALRVDRADLRPAPHARARGDQGSVRSARPDEPGQDRAPSEDGRPHAVPLQARLRGAEARHRARLERVGRRRRWGRLRRGRRDVQQQRPLPQVRRRHHVPVVSAPRGDEQHLTRGRANTLRLALSGPARRRRARLRRGARGAWTSASPARAASANARPASTWRR